MERERRGERKENCKTEVLACSKISAQQVGRSHLMKHHAQGWEIMFVNLGQLNPGRARQNSHATAKGNLANQPGFVFSVIIHLNFNISQMNCKSIVMCLSSLVNLPPLLAIYQARANCKADGANVLGEICSAPRCDRDPKFCLPCSTFEISRCLTGKLKFGIQ